MRILKKFYFLIFFISTSAYAVENINKSLIAAYLNNPKLNAERERTKAVDENLVKLLVRLNQRLLSLLIKVILIVLK